MATSTDPKRELLRHAVATLAYRGGKAVRGAPSELVTISSIAIAPFPGSTWVDATIGGSADAAVATIEPTAKRHGKQRIPRKRA